MESYHRTIVTSPQAFLKQVKAADKLGLDLITYRAHGSWESNEGTSVYAQASNILFPEEGDQDFYLVIKKEIITVTRPLATGYIELIWGV